MVCVCIRIYEMLWNYLHTSFQQNNFFLTSNYTYRNNNSTWSIEVVNPTLQKRKGIFYYFFQRYLAHTGFKKYYSAVVWMKSLNQTTVKTDANLAWTTAREQRQRKVLILNKGYMVNSQCCLQFMVQSNIVKFCFKDHHIRVII